MRWSDPKIWKFSLLFLLVSFLLSFPDVKYNQLLTDEDSWVENITALAFLFSSMVFFKTYWISNGKGLQLGDFKTKRNLVFLFLSLLFFVAFGEEISWGQRIFNWSTPENLANVNYQQETNIHNLDFFTFKNETDDRFFSFLFVFNAGRLFFYFWFAYMVLLPLLTSFSVKFDQVCKEINIPVPSLWVGLLMIANLVIAKLYKIATANMAGDFSGSIDEIQEANYGLIILLLALSLHETVKDRPTSKLA